LNQSFLHKDEEPDHAAQHPCGLGNRPALGKPCSTASLNKSLALLMQAVPESL